ncbi:MULTISPECIES: hypothetical protein [unclassified Nocardia]|uniref:hypothetical protein n=1 Tax=unclassified Nocardia TaxID=2637762 RepID=UPI001CE470CC|nr:MULTISPECIES: hypothetical protein [unclassified Nocardia]
MSGFTFSRGAAGAVLAAACLGAPIASAPQAAAATAPRISVAMAGSALGAAGTASVGCAQTVVATLQRSDGSPVNNGKIDFFSHLAGISGNFVGTAPVSGGTAHMVWAPDIAGSHVISAIYYDGDPDMQQAVGSIVINALNLGGMCL